jgi:tetratricopeptide (TPR) repeat protein
MIRLMKYDNAGGIADYDKAIMLDPSDAHSWNNRAIARRDSGDRAGAIADFKKALEIDPSLPSTRQLLQQLGVNP